MSARVRVRVRARARVRTRARVRVRTRARARARARARVARNARGAPQRAVGVPATQQPAPPGGDRVAWRDAGSARGR